MFTFKLYLKEQETYENQFLFKYNQFFQKMNIAFQIP